MNCDFNENPKSDFDFDLGFVNMLSKKMFDNILLVICRYDLKKMNINVVLIGTHSYKQLVTYKSFFKLSRGAVLKLIPGCMKTQSLTLTST